MASPICSLKSCGQLDVADMCSERDSRLLDACRQQGLRAERPSLWDGFDLATETGAQHTVQFLPSCLPRRVWLLPPCMRGLCETGQTLDKRARHRRDWQVLRNITWVIQQLGENKTSHCTVHTRVSTIILARFPHFEMSSSNAYVCRNVDHDLLSNNPKLFFLRTVKAFEI